MTSKGDIMINPLTQRPVRIGSKTWIQLVKKGIVEGNYKDENILFQELPEDQMEEKIKELNQKLPQGTQAVRGRGKYASKIVKRQKPLSTEEITKNVVKKTTKAVIENIEELDEMDFKNMSYKLENLIMEELMGKPSKKNKKVMSDSEYEDYHIKDNDDDMEDISDEDY